MERAIADKARSDIELLIHAEESGDFGLAENIIRGSFLGRPKSKAATRVRGTNDGGFIQMIHRRRSIRSNVRTNWRLLLYGQHSKVTGVFLLRFAVLPLPRMTRIIALDSD